MMCLGSARKAPAQCSWMAPLVVVDEDVAKYWQENHIPEQVGVVVGIGEHTVVASFPTPSSETGNYITSIPFEL